MNPSGTAERTTFGTGREKPPDRASIGDGMRLEQLNARVGDQLTLLSDKLMRLIRVANNRHPKNRRMPEADEQEEEAVALQTRIRLLGQLAAGLAVIEMDAIPVDSAGYGSTVVGEELFSGRRHEYTLTVGPLVDIDAGQVSLASPIGQALFGRTVGDVVEIDLPFQRLRLRVVSMTTFNDLLEEAEMVTAVD